MTEFFARIKQGIPQFLHIKWAPFDQPGRQFFLVLTFAAFILTAVAAKDPNDVVNIGATLTLGFLTIYALLLSQNQQRQCEADATRGALIAELDRINEKTAKIQQKTFLNAQRKALGDLVGEQLDREMYDACKENLGMLRPIETQKIINFYKLCDRCNEYLEELSKPQTNLVNLTRRKIIENQDEAIGLVIRVHNASNELRKVLSGKLEPGKAENI
jgi:hypothetical protein